MAYLLIVHLSCRISQCLEMQLKTSSPSLRSQHNFLRRLSRMLQMQETPYQPPVVE